MRLHLVRHGRPAIDPQAPASTWELDPAGLADVDRLRTAGVLPTSAAVWFTSTEPKAMQTAERLGAVTPRALDELCEAHRPADWTDRDTFVDAVVRSLHRPDVRARAGWETSADVRVRTLGALGGVVAREAEAQRADDVVLVGHGTAWTVLVAALTHRPPDVDAWRGLRMPDHCALELALERDDDVSGPGPATADVIRPWGSWTTP